MRRSTVLAAALFLAPAVSAQERLGSVNLRVEQVGVASPISMSSLAALIFMLLIVVAAIIYFASYAIGRYKAAHAPKRKAHIEKKAYEEKEPATYAMEHIIIEDEVEKHLKEDERIIVRLLRQREGRCEQGTLCVVSGFSKATLSRLLAELEVRGIVAKERRGKRNMVYLRI